jgi:hypothetical protein
MRWENGPEGEPGNWVAELYRFKRLPWGLNSSPFLLLFVLHNHLLEYAGDDETKKNISERIIENLYMDDLV